MKKENFNSFFKEFHSLPTADQVEVYNEITNILKNTLKERAEIVEKELAYMKDVYRGIFQNDACISEKVVYNKAAENEERLRNSYFPG
jgi:hypothetical protein